MGARTLKTGQSRFFVGYKKHTFRLWLQRYERGVLLVPLVSWVAPANLSEGCLLRPSVAHSWQRWQWRPDFIVGDMGYIDAATKRAVREQWQVAVVTRLKENMNLVQKADDETVRRAIVKVLADSYKELDELEQKVEASIARRKKISPRDLEFQFARSLEEELRKRGA